MLALQLLIDLRKCHRTRAAMSVAVQFVDDVRGRAAERALVETDDVAGAVLARPAMDVNRPVLTVRKKGERVAEVAACLARPIVCALNANVATRKPICCASSTSPGSDEPFNFKMLF